MALAWRGCGMEWKQILLVAQRRAKTNRGRAKLRVEGITQASDPREAITSQTEQKGPRGCPRGLRRGFAGAA